MNDPLDNRLRQLVQEIHDVSPAPRAWETISTTSTAARRHRRPRLLAIGVAAAVLIGAVAVLVIGASRDSHHSIDVTNTEPAATTSTTSASSTTVVRTTSPPTSSVSSTVLPTPATIGVSYRTPPPTLDLQPFASVEVPVSSAGPTALPPIAALDGGRAAVIDDIGHQISVVSLAGVRDVIPLAVDPAPFVVSGGHDIVYGVVQRPTADNAAGAAAVAIPLTGPNAGEEIATEPTDINSVIEAAPTILGHGKDGIVNLRIGGLVIAYRDTDGGRRSLTDEPPSYRLGDDGVVRADNGSTSWELSIEREPGYVGPYVADPDPAQIGNGRAVYWTTIGAPDDPSSGDFPEPSMPVIAILRPDGSGTWYSVPDGWHVVASDDAGVVFARRNGAKVEVALLPDNALGEPSGQSPEQVQALCTALETLDVQRPESYVGSAEQLADLDALAAIASGEIRNDLTVVRTFLASGAVTAADPESNVTANWPTEVQAAIAAVDQFRSAQCGSSSSIPGGELRVPLTGRTSIDVAAFTTVGWGDGPNQIALQNGEFATPAALTANEIYLIENVPFQGLSGRILVLSRDTGTPLRTLTVDVPAGTTLDWLAAAPDGTLYFTTRSSTTGNYDISGFAESGETLRPNGQHATSGSIEGLRLSITARGVEENGVVLIPNDSASKWPTVTSSINDGVGTISRADALQRHDWAVRLELGTGPTGFADTPDVRPLANGVLCLGTTSQDPQQQGDFIAYLPATGPPTVWSDSGPWHIVASDPSGALLAAVTTDGLQLGWLPTP